MTVTETTLDIGSEMDEKDCFRKEDRDELLKHGWQLENIQKAIGEIRDSAKLASGDVEQRLRALESFKWIAWGIGTVIAMLMGWIITLVAAHKP